jgi:CRISPR-associated exonuclease Cas4
VIFDWRLRDETKRAIDAVRQLLREGVTPAAELKPRCDGCSLRGVCMPEVTGSEKIQREAYAQSLLS